MENIACSHGFDTLRLAFASRSRDFRFTLRRMTDTSCGEEAEQPDFSASTRDETWIIKTKTKLLLSRYRMVGEGEELQVLPDPRRADWHNQHQLHRGRDLTREGLSCTDRSHKTRCVSKNKVFAAIERHTQPVSHLGPDALVSPARADWGGWGRWGLLGEGGLPCKHHTDRLRSRAHTRWKLNSHIHKPKDLKEGWEVGLLLAAFTCFTDVNYSSAITILPEDSTGSCLGYEFYEVFIFFFFLSLLQVQ